jgi:hypothetical protein
LRVWNYGLKRRKNWLIGGPYSYRAVDDLQSGGWQIKSYIASVKCGASTGAERHFNSLRHLRFAGDKEDKR